MKIPTEKTISPKKQTKKTFKDKKRCLNSKAGFLHPSTMTVWTRSSFVRGEHGLSYALQDVKKPPCSPPTSCQLHTPHQGVTTKNASPDIAKCSLVKLNYPHQTVLGGQVWKPLIWTQLFTVQVCKAQPREVPDSLVVTILLLVTEVSRRDCVCGH